MVKLIGEKNVDVYSSSILSGRGTGHDWYQYLFKLERGECPPETSDQIKVYICDHLSSLPSRPEVIIAANLAVIRKQGSP